MSHNPPPSAVPLPAWRFITTRWSVVLTAGATEEGCAEQSRAALAELCRVYWNPVYAFVRRRGHSQDDALDLTQEFFTQLIERCDVRRADPSRGRFRTWLVHALKSFLANE